MKSSVGVLLSAASTVMALAVTTGRAEARVDTSSGYRTCPGFYGPFSCDDAAAGWHADSFYFYCGGSSTTAYWGGGDVPGVDFVGWWEFWAGVGCADGTYTSANGPTANGGPATAYCPAGVAVWYGIISMEC